MSDSGSNDEVPWEMNADNPFFKHLQEQQDQWQCQNCTNFHPKSVTKCPSCEKWRPGYEPSKKPSNNENTSNTESIIDKYNLANNENENDNYFTSNIEFDENNNSTDWNISDNNNNEDSTGWTIPDSDNNGWTIPDSNNNKVSMDDNNFGWDYSENESDSEKKTENETTSSKTWSDIMELYKKEISNKLLQFDEFDPKPEYFCYEHDHIHSEMEEEKQFWTTDDENDKKEKKDKKDDKLKEKPKRTKKEEKLMKLKKFRKYMKERNSIQKNMEKELNEYIKNDKKNRIKKDEISDLLLTCGDGTISGVLGRRTDTNEKLEIYYPKLIDISNGNLINERIHNIYSGSMSLAVTTNGGNNLYAWGCNEQSQLCINPYKPYPNLGDDDNEYDDITGKKLVVKEYRKRWYNIYENYTTEDSNARVNHLINKYCDFKFFHKKSYQQMSDHLLDITKKIISKYNKTLNQEIGLEYSAYYPKPSKKELEDRYNKKLNPFKYKKSKLKPYKTQPRIRKTMSRTAKMKNNSKNSTSDVTKITKKLNNTSIIVKKKTRKRRKTISYNSSNNNNSDYMSMSLSSSLSNSDLDDYSSDENNNYLYYKNDKFEEDFQQSISCCYWSPGKIRIPLNFKKPILDISLGACHMVVLDSYGRVYSSGTFGSDGTIGHHNINDPNSSLNKKLVIKYQRTLKCIENTLYNKKLPKITKISSGQNHFLMLGDNGEIYEMGVTQLGQRFSKRNLKNNLLPHRIRSVKNKENKYNKVIFINISCGDYHNLAVSSLGNLYSWGQNNFLQCGHPSKFNGHNNVIDAPRKVLYYENDNNYLLHCENYKNNKVIKDKNIKVKNIFGGTHFSILQDTNNNIWSFGRNACNQLGRITKREKPKKLNGCNEFIRQESLPDLCRKLPQFNNKNCIKFICCGGKFWFLFNKLNNSLYCYGDTGNGSCGVGRFRSARGRKVFDKNNLNFNKYTIKNVVAGQNHSMFWLQIKDKIIKNNSEELFTNEWYKKYNKLKLYKTPKLNKSKTNNNNNIKKNKKKSLTIKRNKTQIISSFNNSSGDDITMIDKRKRPPKRKYKMAFGKDKSNYDLDNDSEITDINSNNSTSDNSSFAPSQKRQRTKR